MTIAPQIRLEGELGHNPHGTKGPVSGKGSRTGQRTWSVYLARCGQLVIRKHRKATLTPPCRGVAAQRKGNWVGGWVGGGDLCQLPRPHNAAHAIKDSPPPAPYNPPTPRLFLWGWWVDKAGIDRVTTRGRRDGGMEGGRVLAAGPSSCHSALPVRPCHTSRLISGQIQWPLISRTC